MNLKFWKTEKRTGYADTIIAAIQATASGPLATDYTATGAAEAGASLLGRCLAVATVEPEPVAKALTPRIRMQIGRDLMMSGNSVYEIIVGAAGIRLRRSASWDVYGQDHWRYRLSVPGANTETQVVRDQDAVLHFRINESAADPARGRSPLYNNSAGRLLAGLENQLANESGQPSGYALPAPTEGFKKEDLEDLKSDLRTSKGKTQLVPSMSLGWGEGRTSAPQSVEWRPQRYGMNPPEVLARLRLETNDTVLGALGVPSAFYSTEASSAALREALRIYLHSTLQPIADVIRQELQEKLLPNVKLSFDRLFASDLQGRARAFQSLVTAGMTVEKAAALSGLLASEE